MTYSIHQLMYFRDAVLLGVVGASAERNRVSPSAVSQAIRALESHFEMELLEHARNRFVLTADGKLLLESTHSVFGAIEELEERVSASRNMIMGEVMMATQQSIAYSLFPKFLGELQLSHAGVRPNIQLGTTDVVHQWIESRKVEFGISLDNFGDHNFQSVTIYRGRFVFVASKTIRKWDQPELAFILPGETTRESRAFKSNYKKLTGRAPHVPIEIKSWGVVKRLAESGLGVGLIPDYLLRFDQKSDLKTIKTDFPAIEYEINAYYTKDRGKLPRQSQFFLDRLKDFAKNWE